MKTEPNTAVKKVREIIGRTQTEFAAMIGSTRDTVASWESGRNRLSREMAFRIQFATGASAKDLLQPDVAEVFGIGDCARGAEYTAEYFEWHKTKASSAINMFYRTSANEMHALLRAASVPGPGKLKDRLAGVWWSFMVWMRDTVKDFKLEHEFQDALNELVGVAKAPPGKPQKVGAFPSYYSYLDDNNELDDLEVDLMMLVQSGKMTAMEAKAIWKKAKLVQDGKMTEKEAWGGKPRIPGVKRQKPKLFARKL